MLLRITACFSLLLSYATALEIDMNINESSFYSPNGEDGVFSRIFATIKPASRHCVECGVGDTISNSLTYLLRNQGWKATLFDRLVEMYNQNDLQQLAYDCIKKWEKNPKPTEKDYNAEWMERYGLLFQCSICSYYAGQYQESLESCDILLTIDDFPKEWRERALDNREFPLIKLQSLLS